MGKIGFIAILIVALGIGLYLYTSGALVNGLSGFNNLISASSTFSFFHTNGSSTVTGPSGPFGPGTPGGATGSGGSQQSTTGSTSSGGATSTIDPSQIPAGYTVAQLSPYFHKIRLGSISAATSYYYGTIALNAALDYNATTSIDVTGWQIKTNSSGEYIPGAVNLYDASGLTSASDIRMKSGDVVYMYSSSAPFNLRLNECIGYVAKSANFTPALPLSCPYVDPAAIQNFTGACQNYIRSIGGCSAGNVNDPQVPRSDYACQSYIQSHFTYRSCLDEHESDPNFFSNQVWVWTGSNVVDQYHDKVRLLDKNGLLVDLYSY